ncbi:MAG: hypothetical protein M3O50_09250 [Myxococcota bacterium]|nr:hypothetical protein [Myxococcota bacterium]
MRPGDGALLDGPASGAGITVTTSAGSSPPLAAVASSATESLVVWVVTGSGAPAVKAARIRSSDGALLDPTSLAISAPLAHPLTGANAESSPIVATDGARYFVAWADDRYAAIGAMPRFFGALFGPSGESLLPACVPLAIGATSLASDGTVFLTTDANAGVSSRIRASDALEMDTPAGIPVRNASLSNCSNEASSACLGGICLVAVTCYVPQFPWPTKKQVIVQRVRASDGTALDAAGIHVTATQDSHNGLPVVGAGASSFLVVWQNYITGISSVTKAARVDASGNVGPAFTVGLGEDPKAVTSNGSDFFVLLDGRQVWGTRVRESDLALVDGLPGQGAIPIAAWTAGMSMGATYDARTTSLRSATRALARPASTRAAYGQVTASFWTASPRTAGFSSGQIRWMAYRSRRQGTAAPSSFRRPRGQRPMAQRAYLGRSSRRATRVSRRTAEPSTPLSQPREDKWATQRLATRAAGRAMPSATRPALATRSLLTRMPVRLCLLCRTRVRPERPATRPSRPAALLRRAAG